ncbi:MAG: hypothetical protein V4551_16010 [Pseudomonadota bacterium]|nr:hypothetical protein [Tabrizicola sp.]OYX18910.1 MAG: hypothetical protein B7Z04_10895 [Rhodobacterales bacterium 32-66-9]
MKFQQVYAVVDSEYRVLWVGGEWDEFALSGGANGAISNKVLSTSVMSQIAGEDTRAATARMIDAVLKHRRTLRLEYRCDSPGMARKFLMTIQPMKEGRALMVHDLRDAWHFSPPLNRWHYDSAARDTKCSFCGNVRFDGDSDWTRCEEIGERHPTHVTYDICQPCLLAVDRAVEEVLDATDTVAPVEAAKLPR